MKKLWQRLRRRTNALVIEGAARGLVMVGLFWLLARLWRDQRRQQRLGAEAAGSRA